MHDSFSRAEKMYWFYYIIGKDPNHPKLQETQETRVNRIKGLAKKHKLYYHIERFEDEVHIYVKTNEPIKVVTLKLVFPRADYQYDRF